ncbi:LOW QUALITY PROTEIN: hypothetical protein CFC21_068663 [Triticum aestivum]|uniref:Uncharacterized protein n=2 Tax=Triticum aestivum TaxID=4565 RepID=A0A9R1KPX1_WHEAT|nr:LOW QUALITY PROTEIN: hypothetical protein CFC21_068663 [Triticum aestivum]
MPEGATALEIPTDRPAFVTRVYFDGPPAATAVRLAFPPRTERPESIKVYMKNFKRERDPEALYHARRFAHAYITPPEAPCRADPGPFIRRAFRTLALDLPQNFELLPVPATCHDDMAVRFRAPDHREAAMRRQPFVLDGVTVRLVREAETPNVRRVSNERRCMRAYPVEQRTEEMVRDNCSQFGFVREIDPACFAAPDLSTVRVVLQNEHPREVPHELRILYDDGFTSVVPVEIVGVWHRSHSCDVNGQYVPLELMDFKLKQI